MSAKINWQEKFRCVKIQFPVALDQYRGIYEIPFGCIEKACNGEEEPVQRWRDLSGMQEDNNKIICGIGILNDCKYSACMEGNSMELTVLRSPAYAHHNPYILDEEEILDGKLYNGANNMAGEVGHVRMTESGPVGFGKSGSFEGFCSGGGIAAKRGDPLALDIYETSGCYLGRGLAILIDILNPEIIVLGSVYERSEELLWPFAQRVIEQEALAISREGCRIVPAELGNKIGDYAALSVAIQGGKNGQRKCSL